MKSSELSQNDRTPIECGKYYDCLIQSVAEFIPASGNEFFKIILKTTTGESHHELILKRPSTYWKIGQIYQTLGMDDAEVGDGLDAAIHDENLKGCLIGCVFKARTYKEKTYTEVAEWRTIPENREDEVAECFSGKLPF
jgi:hypothetical protein